MHMKAQYKPPSYIDFYVPALRDDNEVKQSMILSNTPW